MIKDGIYNLKSIAFAKDFYKFSNHNKFEKNQKTLKLKSVEYSLDREHIEILAFNKDIYKINIKHADAVEHNNILIKHTIFNFYVIKYKLKNLYMIANIEEFYAVTKYLIRMWNDKNYGNNEQLIHLNHDSIFYMLKHYEKELYDIEKYKLSKLNDIFVSELIAQLKQF